MKTKRWIWSCKPLVCSCLVMKKRSRIANNIRWRFLSSVILQSRPVLLKFSLAKLQHILNLKFSNNISMWSPVFLNSTSSIKFTSLTKIFIYWQLFFFFNWKVWEQNKISLFFIGFLGILILTMFTYMVAGNFDHVAPYIFIN